MTEAQRRVLLIGSSVRQSFSIAFQNAGFQAAGLDWRYEAADVAPPQLSTLIEEARRDPGFKGANVTIPHKEAVLPLLDSLDATARAVGAVNTISRSATGLSGWNTDGVGFRRALDELGFDPRGAVVVVIGAGGAARAVAASLLPLVDQLFVANRTRSRAEDLCRDLELRRGGAIAIEDLERVVKDASLVINATPADVAAGASITSPRLYFDLRSRRSITGRLMLLHQGIAAFEIWTGQPAPVGAMRAALLRAAEGAVA